MPPPAVSPSPFRAAGVTVAEIPRRRPRRAPEPEAEGEAGGWHLARQPRHEVRGRVITARSHGYTRASEVYNERYDGAHPLAIVEASDDDDVRAAVRWAGRRDVTVVPRSGGHSYAGYSTGDGVLVIDVSRLDSVSVDKSAGEATIGAGAQLINVYSALDRAGATIPAGSCPSVGIGGHAPAGGMGLAGRQFGLACDNIEGLSIVTADGRLLNADSGTEPGLYWANRGGGGGNFGVTTRYRMKIHPVSSVSYFSLNWPWSSAGDAIEAWQHFAPSAPAALTSLFSLATGSSTPAVSSDGQYFGSEAKLRKLLAPLVAVGGANLTTGTMSYMKMMLYWAGCADSGLAACHTEGTWPGGTMQRSSFIAKSDYAAKPFPLPAGRR